MIMTGETDRLGEKLVPVPVRPSHIAYSPGIEPETPR
jgi:hypothetical protein